MPGDPGTITVRRIDAAEAAFALGVILAGAGCLHGEGVSTITGATLVLLGAIGAWRELDRGEECVTREPTPRTSGSGHTSRHAADDFVAPRNRRRVP